MNTRYPAPVAERIWSAERRIDRLRQITDLYTIDAIRDGLLGDEFGPRAIGLVQSIEKAPDPTPAAWEMAELAHGHDVVGFLDAYLDRLPAEVHPYVHYGLTSSDLVEFDLHRAVSEHALILRDRLSFLGYWLDERAHDPRFSDPRAGRTHGQTAERTTLRHQFKVFAHQTYRIRNDLNRLINEGLGLVIKSPGPTGFSNRSAPRPYLEAPSTQVIPRDYLLAWAALYLRAANLLDQMATFVRLGARSEIGEFREGAADSRVGSSAMPGKRNPIQSERVCGLARVARGHFLALAEVSNLWEDRDLSNSSTERLAVPGLAGIVEFMADQTIEIFRDLEVDHDQIAQNAGHARTTTNREQMRVQREEKIGPIEASKRVTHPTTLRSIK